MDSHEIASEIIKCFKNGNKLLVCGNGGSASMSDHFVGEFVGKFEKERRALPAISLSSNCAVISAIGNDYDFSLIFSRQVEALGKKGDILITLSTSGESKNIHKASEVANTVRMLVIPFPTKHDPSYAGLSTADIQEIHLEMIHNISRIVEGAFVI